MEEIQVQSNSSVEKVRLAIVIINYRKPQLVIDCLKSLQNQVELEHDRVIIVDNDSGDNSVELLQQTIIDNQWFSWVKLLASPV
ncbi:MAG: glycosyltransferase family 2 protein, partial [Planktothrix sp.]